jgi:hypothetical protein
MIQPRTGKKPGRPTKYNQRLGAEICRRLSTGRTLRDVARDRRMPAESTIRGWANSNTEGFAAQYSRAREIGYQAMADEILEIADDGTKDWIAAKGREGEGKRVLNSEHVQRSKLRVDARKWLLTNALPKMPANKTEQGASSGPLVVEIVRFGNDPPS